MMNKNLLLTVAAIFAISASGANAAQVDFHPVQTEKLEKSNKVESYQTGGSGRGAAFDKTETTIGSATGGAGAGKTKARKSMGWDVIPQHCRGLACANGEH
jgi:hypothetical protein